MSGMIGSARINLQQTMDGFNGLFDGVARMPGDPHPIAMNTQEKLLAQLLFELKKKKKLKKDFIKGDMEKLIPNISISGKNNTVKIGG